MNGKSAKLQPSVVGTIAAFGAYVMWGLLPLYWRMLASVPSSQILGNRIVWAAAFCAILLAARKRFGEIARLFKDKNTFAVVLAAACVMVPECGPS